MRVACSPDGKSIAISYVYGTIAICGATDGKEICSWKAHHSSGSIAYSPDGKRVASGGYGRVGVETELKVFWADSGKPVFGPVAGSGLHATTRYSADGKRLFWLSESLEVLDATSGKRIFECNGSDDAHGALACSRDQRWLASCFVDTMASTGDLPAGVYRIQLWDAATGKKSKVLRGHVGAVQSLAFSPDSKLLASVNGANHCAGELKLWDVRTGQQRAAIFAHSSFAWSVEFSPDGKRLATTSSDETVKIWEVEKLLGKQSVRADSVLEPAGQHGQ